MARRLVFGLGAVALLLSACGSDQVVPSTTAAEPTSPYLEAEFLDSHRLIRAEARAAAQPCLDEMAAGRRADRCHRYNELAGLFEMSARDIRRACDRAGASPVAECDQADLDPVRRREYVEALERLTTAQEG